ncbi:uncharacterized protein [Macrobrachium rosenbergii]|uniref:uncharacterized protein n=1 Tax=Macrobrachium rosenbergii TaxID=79674 RepID=UPI0034D6A08B
MPIDIKSLDCFSIGEDPKSVGTRWKQWIGSFEIYLEAIGKVDKKQQKALLLHTAGKEVQELYKTLNLTNGSLEDTIEGLTNYFAPQVNKYFERHQFVLASQESGEKIDTFVTRLKKLAATCEFVDIEESLIERIIEGSNSQELQKQLLQVKKLTLQKVLEIARALEMVNYQSNVSSSSNEDSVHKTTEVEEFAFHINSVNKDAQERLMAQIEINGKLTPMQIDTAADVTIISERVAQTIPNLVLRPSDKVLKSYNGTNIEVVGSSQVKVQYNNQEIGKLPLTVVKGKGQTLLVLDWLRCIKLDWPSILRVTGTKQEPTEEISITNLLSDYKEVFEDRVGTVKNAQAVLVLKKNATPRFFAQDQFHMH